MSDTSCPHRVFKHRACADAYLDAFACTACGRRFAMPRLVSRPRLGVLKDVLRKVRSLPGGKAPPRAWYELACSSKDVPYLAAFLSAAHVRVQVPEYASQLLVSAR